MHIDILDDIVHKHNRSTIKIKSVDVNSNTYIESSKKLIIKILNLKLLVLL